MIYFHKMGMKPDDTKRMWQLLLEYIFKKSAANFSCSTKGRASLQSSQITGQKSRTRLERSFLCLAGSAVNTLHRQSCALGRVPHPLVSPQAVLGIPLPLAEADGKVWAPKPGRWWLRPEQARFGKGLGSRQCILVRSELLQPRDCNPTKPTPQCLLSEPGPAATKEPTWVTFCWKAWVTAQAQRADSRSATHINHQLEPTMSDRCLSIALKISTLQRHPTRATTGGSVSKTKVF